MVAFGAPSRSGNFVWQSLSRHKMCNHAKIPLLLGMSPSISLDEHVGWPCSSTNSGRFHFHVCCRVDLLNSLDLGETKLDPGETMQAGIQSNFSAFERVSSVSQVCYWQKVPHLCVCLAVPGGLGAIGILRNFCHGILFRVGLSARPPRDEMVQTKCYTFGYLLRQICPS